MTSARSALYVPADRTDMLVRAMSRGADALILDLEDSVGPANKQLARDAVGAFLRTQSAAADTALELWVRVNPSHDGLADIASVAAPALTGFVLAKAEDEQDVQAAAHACVDAESRLGLPADSLSLCPLLESAGAVLDARAIATASPRVSNLQIGEADLRADLGVSLGADERELLMVRSAVVLASAAAGIAPPIAAVSTDFTNLASFRASTQALQRLGFRGRACIHPAQCLVANEVFTPDPTDVHRAKKLISRYEATGANAVFLDDDGRMVDVAVIRAARRLVAFAVRATERP